MNFFFANVLQSADFTHNHVERRKSNHICIWWHLRAHPRPRVWGEAHTRRITKRNNIKHVCVVKYVNKISSDKRIRHFIIIIILVYQIICVHTMMWIAYCVDSTHLYDTVNVSYCLTIIICYCIILKLLLSQMNELMLEIKIYFHDMPTYVIWINKRFQNYTLYSNEMCP